MSDSPVAETKKFTSDIVSIAVSNTFIILTHLVAIFALTRCCGSETYGAWVQIWVTVGLLTPILSLQLGNAAVRFLAAEEDRDRRRRAFGAMLWPVAAFGCILLLVTLLLRQNLATVLFADPGYVSLVPLIFLWALLNAVFFFCISYFRARGKIKRLAFIQLALEVAKMALIAALALTGYSLNWIITCLIVGQALFVAAVFGIITREVGFPYPSFEGLKRYLAFSVPLIPAGSLMWVMDSSDRYFITHLLNLSEAGIYSASYYVGSLISLLYMPIGVVLLPTISKLWEQEQLPRLGKYLEYSMKLFLTLAIPGVAGLYILSQPLLGVLSTSEFKVGGGLVLLIGLGILLLGIYQINVYVSFLVQKTKWLLLIFAIGALINAGINVALIPQIGIMGAAVSTIVSYFVLSAIVTIWANRVIGYNIDFKFLIKVVVATVLMGFCLRFIEIGSAPSIVLAVIMGVAIFGLGLFVLKAFSREDKELARAALSGLNPKLWIKGRASR